MVGGTAILFSEAGEVWGVTEEAYDTIDPSDDDLMARCTAQQAATCPVPFSPLTCSVRCIDFVAGVSTRSALDAVSAQFGGYCPAVKWAPTNALSNGNLVEVQLFDFEAHGMPAFPGRWCILTTTPRGNIYQKTDKVKDSNVTVRIAAIIGASIAILLMVQALASSMITAQRLTRQQYVLKLERVTKAARSITSCNFSVCFCKYSAFKEYGQMIPHERALVKGDLVFLHTYQDVLTFVSMFPTVFFSQ